MCNDVPNLYSFTVFFTKYYWTDQLQNGELEGTCCMGSMFKYIKILIRKLEGKRRVGGFRYRCKDVTNMNIREMGCEYVSWFPLALDGFQK